jgi:DNA-binding HxlR family transcriptional regulator
MDADIPGQNLDWQTVSMDNCPVAGALQVLGDKWTLLIVRDAFNGIKRFGEFCAHTGAPRALVASRLKDLIERGIMTRETYQEPGSRQRQQYVLTAKGRDLQHTLISLREWGDKYINQPGEHPLELVDIDSGQPVRMGLVRQHDDQLVQDARVRVQPGPGLRRQAHSGESTST